MSDKNDLSDSQKKANAEAFVAHISTIGRSLDKTASLLSAGGAFDRRQIRIAWEAEVRKQLVRKAKEDNPELTTRELADQFAVGKSTIDRDLVPDGTSIEQNGHENEAFLVPSGTDYLRPFLRKCLTTVDVDRLSGPVDDSLLDKCRQIARAWTALVQKLEDYNA